MASQIQDQCSQGLTFQAVMPTHPRGSPPPPDLLLDMGGLGLEEASALA